jgi:hypothetical protein
MSDPVEAEGDKAKRFLKSLGDISWSPKILKWMQN